MKDISVKGLTKSFSGNQVVSGVSFDLPAGQFLTLLGPSGCGKTTTLRMLAGLETPDAGTIEVGGRLLAAGEKRISTPPEKRGMGMVFQNYAIWPHKTVFQNVAFPLQMRKLPKAEIRERVLATLDTVGLGGFHDRPAPLLSGGQQQRVALARAVVFNPDVLLLDEPLSNLDAALREDMRFELKGMQARLGLTTVFVTHDQAEAMALSDQVVVMNSGHVEQQDTPRGVYERPQTQFVMGVLGQVNQMHGEVTREDDGTRAVVVSDAQGRVRLRLPGVDGFDVGAEVALTFRTEAVRLSPDRGALGGVVASTVYLGRHAEHLIRVGNATLRASSPPDQLLEAGERVRLELNPDAVRIWAADALRLATENGSGRQKAGTVQHGARDGAA
jgi:iron(III) transport system ATP-binding protein